MYLKLLLLALILFGWTNVAIFILILNLVISNFGKKIFAGGCAKCFEDYNKVSNPMKTELFTELNNMRKGEKISILEVGTGPGTNFKYFNRPAVVQSVEPNCNFKGYFDENRAKFPNLDINEIKQGFGEDLATAGIADSSVDAVVMTLVLCSVADQVTHSG